MEKTKEADKESMINRFISMIENKMILYGEKIVTRSENNKTIISLSLPKHPYHDDTVDIAEFDFESNNIYFYEQHRIIFQEMLEKLYTEKDNVKLLKLYYNDIITDNKTFTDSKNDINSLIDQLGIITDFDKIKALFTEIFKKLNFIYKAPKDSSKETTDYLTRQLIKAIAAAYTKEWIKNKKLVLSFDLFDHYYSSSKKQLSSALVKIRDNMNGYCFGKQITEQVKPVIDKEYLESAKIAFNLNAGNIHSAVIVVDNNPWRNGIIKGDLLFAKIKAEGKIKYINFKNSLAYLFEKMNIEYSANNTERENDLIRIDLELFMTHLNNPENEFKKIMNTAFLSAISFPEFGCCSKFNECKISGKCLHTDQLYATACQYQKLMKRTVKCENT